eukprot:224816_1
MIVFNQGWRQDGMDAIGFEPPSRVGFGVSGNDAFKQNDDVNATETSGLFGDIQWAKPQETPAQEETLIAEIPFLKLYRFGKDVAQVPCWKIRAAKSKICFYKSNTNGKIRMIAREQETNKLRMDQFVPKSEDSAFGLKSSNVYQWHAYDSSIAAEEDDAAAGVTMWCIKLGSEGDYSKTFENEFR